MSVSQSVWSAGPRPQGFSLKKWVGTRLSAELCVITVIVFFLPYPVKFYLIYLVQSFARSHWPLWRNAVCTAAPLPSKEKWIGERDCLLFFVFVLFVCLFVCFYHLFRERLSEKVHATIPKGIVGGFEFPVVPKNLKEWQEMPWTYVCECLWKATKVGYSTTTVVKKSVLIISHITFRDCRVHVFPTTFLEIAAYLSHKYWRTGEGN